MAAQARQRHSGQLVSRAERTDEHAESFARYEVEIASTQVSPMRVTVEMHGTFGEHGFAACEIIQCRDDASEGGAASAQRRDLVTRAAP